MTLPIPDDSYTKSICPSGAMAAGIASHYNIEFFSKPLFLDDPKIGPQNMQEE